jgi:polyhydroxyalkanoate synthesis regulator phasin
MSEQTGADAAADAAADAEGSGGAEQGGGAEAGGPEDDQTRRSRRERVSDGFQRGLGVLSAFKDALEETIAEARERGDLSTDRAREVMRGAMGRARDATAEARERFDFVTQQEFDDLARRVSALEDQLRKSSGGGLDEG